LPSTTAWTVFSLSSSRMPTVMPSIFVAILVVSRRTAGQPYTPLTSQEAGHFNLAATPA
jgi:hypothetical protein